MRALISAAFIIGFVTAIGAILTAMSVVNPVATAIFVGIAGTYMTTALLTVMKDNVCR